MTSTTTVVSSQRVSNLQVRGFYSSERISLPPVYTRDFIPANRTHIPTNETAEAWPHLEHLQSEIAPLQDCEVGLLIGYDCSQALLPREVVAGKENEPYAQRTDLGWSIVGNGNPCVDYGDATGISHRIVVRQVIPDVESSVNLKRVVHYVSQTKVKEVTPSDIIRILESDFSERTGDDIVSQDDLKFLTKLRENIVQNDTGHFEMPLPFKEDRPKLPNNKICAIHRLKCLERRLKKNQQYYRDYVSFMNDIISCGDAEKVPDEENDEKLAWYIPHHGVYHPQKPGKMRVVFDCSAKFQETSLNDHLLTGPDLTNTLVGVLCRFRKGSVAIMCDIERMFHQFHVKREDQDYLRFLWWENGNLETSPSVYRMKVHLFGAASSPGCALPSDFGNVKRYELHHFSDASFSGYGVCTYLRAISESDEVHCSLVMGKSRVSPISVTTIPSLELTAAVVAARTSDMLRSELEIQDPEFFWTDSTVVLGYINNDARRFQVYVANRIQRIKSSTNPEQWGYVASEDNPADHASRGLTAERLRTSNWFTGPTFLWQKELPGRQCKVGEIKEDDPELRKVIVCNTKSKEDRSLLDNFKKFSDWSRLSRAIARLKRYIRMHKGIQQRTSDSTSLEERKEAELVIIKLVQEEAFSDEIKSLKRKTVVENSPL
ncbi:unnamed protein product [Oreochromis niloticus]|nr:unnamed protein product [Mustela putorius furo]